MSLKQMLANNRCKRKGHTWTGPACNQKCSVCGMMGSSADHQYERRSGISASNENICGIEECKVCRMRRTIQHNWTPVANKKCVMYCSGCHTEKAFHQYATPMSPVCKICGYRRAIIDPRTGRVT